MVLVRGDAQDNRAGKRQAECANRGAILNRAFADTNVGDSDF